MSSDHEGLAAITSAWLNQNKDGIVTIPAKDAQAIHAALLKTKYLHGSTVKLERLLQAETRRADSLQRQCDAYRNVLKKMKFPEPVIE